MPFCHISYGLDLKIQTQALCMSNLLVPQKVMRRQLFRLGPPNDCCDMEDAEEFDHLR